MPNDFPGPNRPEVRKVSAAVSRTVPFFLVPQHPLRYVLVRIMLNSQVFLCAALLAATAGEHVPATGGMHSLATSGPCCSAKCSLLPIPPRTRITGFFTSIATQAGSTCGLICSTAAKL